jgi:flagellar biosynthesis/type III secretory pathway protein FliH
LNLFSAGGGFLSETVMQESSVYKHLVETADEERYQQGIQQGTEQGARQSTIRDLSAVLEFRFDRRAVQTLRPALENIQNLQRLQALHNEALRAETFEAFAHTLDMNGNEQ